MNAPGRSRPRPAMAVAWVVGAALGLAACGIPTGGGPTAIAKADVPFHLLNPPTASTTTTTPSGAVQPESIYLADPSQRVAPVAREVAVPSSPSDTINEVLDALLDGPTAEESAAGLQSFLVTGTKPQVSTSISGTVATVDFTTPPVPAGSPNQVLAIAQIVFTVTQRQFGINAVSIQINGQAAAVPTATGATVSGPVGQLSYLPQAPVA